MVFFRKSEKRPTRVGVEKGVMPEKVFIENSHFSFRFEHRKNPKLVFSLSMI